MRLQSSHYVESIHSIDDAQGKTDVETIHPLPDAEIIHENAPDHVLSVTCLSEKCELKCYGHTGYT